MAQQVQAIDEAVVIIEDDDEGKEEAKTGQRLSLAQLFECEKRSKAANAQIDSLQYLELLEKHYAAKALALEGCDVMYEPQNRPDPRFKPTLPDRAELSRNPMAHGLYSPTWPLDRFILGLLRQEELEYDPMSPKFPPGIVEHLTVEHPESAWADVEPAKYEPDLREVLKGAGELDELEAIRRQCEDDYSPNST
ncbi:hypothetical protein KC331_g11119 [Hortaea werneckii]|nr:hypothetical protein KC331_g11119 [Hortaea werneckii]KAI7709165.1 hypothetical protein KC353_g10567 [Hortaea werneckii]